MFYGEINWDLGWILSVLDST